MRVPLKPAKVNPRGSSEQEARNQEVLRANKVLAAYFKGRRTEREARAALKIIKAFIRNRERLDPAGRAPLPLVPSAAPKPARRIRPNPREPHQRQAAAPLRSIGTPVEPKRPSTTDAD